MANKSRAAHGAVAAVVRDRFDEIVGLWASGVSVERIIPLLKLNLEGLELKPMQVREVIYADRELRAIWDQARAERAHALHERALDIAHTAVESGEPACVNKAIDTLLKVASKLSPDEYEERQRVELSGPNGSALRVEADVSLSPAEAYERMILGK